MSEKYNYNTIFFFKLWINNFFMEINQSNFITNLKFYRGEKGVSQEKLAEFCDVSVGTIGNIECGITKPSFDLLVRISASLSVPISKFFETEDEIRKKIDDKEKLSHYQTSVLLDELQKSVFKSVSSVLEKFEYKIDHE